MSLSLQSTFTIAPGVEMPRVGLGVFRSGSGDGTRDAVITALDVGYRHVDTAAVYRNEVEVGEALRRSAVNRGEVFVTTKLWNTDHGYDAALSAFDRSLESLGLDYVDLYLIHWPMPDKRLDSWRALEAIHASGRARAIGVSNYTPAHLDELLATCSIPPAVNQVEVHPYLPQKELRKYCAGKEITVVAYSPLTKGTRLMDPALQALAADVGRSTAQVLLRWGLQKGHAILPKSANARRIGENAALFDFELDAAQMAQLDALADGGRTAWDPTTVE